MSPPQRRGKQRIRWAASSPVLSGIFRTFRRTQRARAGSKRRSRQLPDSLGQRLGQSADLNFCPDHFSVKAKKVLKSNDFGTFMVAETGLEFLFRAFSVFPANPA